MARPSATKSELGAAARRRPQRAARRVDACASASVPRVLALLALASSVVWGTSDFVAGMASKSRPAAAVVGWSQTAALAAITGLVLVKLPDFPGGTWPLWAALAGAAGSSALVCFYVALSTGTMGVVAPIASLGVVVPIILGVLGGEQPSALAWVGMIVAVIGVLLASGPELSGTSGRRPVLLAALAGVGFGTTFYALDRGSRVSLIHTLWGMRLTSVLAFALVALLLRRAGGLTLRDSPILVVIGLADLLANALFAIASSGGYVSVASVLGSLYPVTTAALAFLVLRERLRPIQFVGGALTVLAVLLIAAGG